MSALVDHCRLTLGCSLFKRDAAEELVKRLNAEDDDGWLYVAVHDPKGTGYSFVNVFDENGNQVGRL